MNPEKVKVEKFFYRLLDKSVTKAVSWFLIGIFVFVIIGLCMIPAQEIYSGAEDSPSLMSFVLLILSVMMVSTRISPYIQYTENQKSRTMIEILKYYPISKKEICKFKMNTMCIFLAKVAGVGLAVQLVSSFIAYQTISWMNFVYILLNIFIIPVAGEFIPDWIRGNYAEE